MEKNKVDQYNFVINQSETRFATEDYRANEATKKAIYSDPSSHFLWFHVGTFWQFLAAIPPLFSCWYNYSM